MKKIIIALIVCFGFLSANAQFPTPPLNVTLSLDFKTNDQAQISWTYTPTEGIEVTHWTVYRSVNNQFVLVDEFQPLAGETTFYSVDLTNGKNIFLVVAATNQGSFFSNQLWVKK